VLLRRLRLNRRRRLPKPRRPLHRQRRRLPKMRVRASSAARRCRQFEKVFNAFKAAVVGGDRAAVVEEVRFPLNIAAEEDHRPR
jgi:hypothetical protein